MIQNEFFIPRKQTVNTSIGEGSVEEGVADATRFKSSFFVVESYLCAVKTI